MHRQADLFQVILALQMSGRFARGLDCGEEEADEDSDNGQDRKKFDEAEGVAARHGLGGSTSDRQNGGS